MAEVLNTRPRAVLKTEDTVFPNTDRLRPVNNIFLSFFHKKTRPRFATNPQHCAHDLQNSPRLRTEKKVKLIISNNCYSCIQESLSY